jgi:hypothetical protein
MPPHFLAKRRGKSGLLFVGCLLVSGLASYQFASWAGELAFGRQNFAADITPDAKTTPPTLLVPSPAKLDLGALPKGGRASATFSLRNPTQRIIEIGEVTTSCPCLEIALAGQKVLPGGEIMASAVVDFSQEPTFTGKLRLEASGFIKSEAALEPGGFSYNDSDCAFRIYVGVQVWAGSEYVSN